MIRITNSGVINVATDVTDVFIHMYSVIASSPKADVAIHIPSLDCRVAEFTPSNAGLLAMT
jgi:hypothetical protein